MRTRIPGAVGTLFALDMAVKQYIEENRLGFSFSFIIT